MNFTRDLIKKELEKVYRKNNIQYTSETLAKELERPIFDTRKFKIFNKKIIPIAENGYQLRRGSELISLERLVLEDNLKPRTFEGDEFIKFLKDPSISKFEKEYQSKQHLRKFTQPK